MANTTKNYGLIKPLENEYYDVNIQNSNMDAIDSKLKNLENAKFDKNAKLSGKYEEGTSYFSRYEKLRDFFKKLSYYDWTKSGKEEQKFIFDEFAKAAISLAKGNEKFGLEEWMSYFLNSIVLILDKIKAENMAKDLIASSVDETDIKKALPAYLAKSLLNSLEARVSGKIDKKVSLIGGRIDDCLMNNNNTFSKSKLLVPSFNEKLFTDDSDKIMSVKETIVDIYLNTLVLYKQLTELNTIALHNKERIEQLQHDTLKSNQLVNNLVTDNQDLPLSAKQGKILKDNINEMIKNSTSIPRDKAFGRMSDKRYDIDFVKDRGIWMGDVFKINPESKDNQVDSNSKFWLNRLEVTKTDNIVQIALGFSVFKPFGYHGTILLGWLAQKYKPVHDHVVSCAVQENAKCVNVFFGHNGEVRVWDYGNNHAFISAWCCTTWIYGNFYDDLKGR